ncbi:MAG: hypothetical protein AAF394_00380 [Planctomycetota bacterium]
MESLFTHEVLLESELGVADSGSPSAFGSCRKVNRNQRKVRSGYVLVLVLVTLVLAATLLVRLASRTKELRVQGIDEVTSLQEKWGQLSCERAALGQAATHFERIEKNRDLAIDSPFPSQVRQSLALGGMRFDMLVADENAKANLNLVLDVASEREEGKIVRREIDAILRALVPPSLVTELHLRPVLPSQYWGQVFDLQAIQRRHGAVRALAEATQGISLTGAGPLNVRRAKKDVIRAVAASVVPEGRADRFVETLGETPNSDVEIVLRRTIKNNAEREMLALLLSDRSANFSVWTEAWASGSPRSLSFREQFVDAEGEVRTGRFLLH